MTIEQLNSVVDVLSYTSKWLILCYVDFALIKKIKQKIKESFE